MAKEKDSGIRIEGDSKESVNVVGDKNTVYQLFIVDPEKLPANFKELIRTKTARPYEIPGTTLHNLPYSQNPFFTGRENVLDELHTSLTATGSTTALSQPQAIAGLGGIGKTQIAIEYAYRHMNDYQAILWVNSETAATLTASYSEIARLLALPEKDEKESQVVVNAVKTWLQTHKGWLLILDNADEPEIIGPYLPTSHEGMVLLTSRATAFGNSANALEIHEMDPNEAVEFLIRRCKIDDPSASDRQTAENICSDFGFLPLAIDQAGAFVEMTHCGLPEYHELFRETGLAVLKDERYVSGTYRHTVATTWLMSIEKVRKESQGAEDILKLSSFLAPDEIPLDAITGGAGSFPEPLKSTVSNPLEFTRALGVLQSYSLIKRQQGANQFSMHRLLQAVIREGFDDKEKRHWVDLGVVCATEALPDVDDYRNWPDCERVVPHVLSLAERAGPLDLSTQAVANLLGWTGHYLQLRADYDPAESLFQRALEIREEVLGPKDPSVATSLNNLGLLYKTRGKYDQAEPLYQRALEISDEVLGPKHPDVATSLNNIGVLYETQGKYDQAEPLYRRALEIDEEVFGSDHPEVAMDLNNLGGLYGVLGRVNEAEPLCQRALAIMEKVLDPKHPLVATSLNSLAWLYFVQCKYDHAAPLWQRALEIREKVLGPKHPSVATSLNNLAELYRAQGKYDQADLHYRRALEIDEEVHGPKHLRVATVLHNLGTMLYEVDREEQGVAMERRAYAIRLEILGPDHPHTQGSLGYLDSWGVKP